MRLADSNHGMPRRAGALEITKVKNWKYSKVLLSTRSRLKNEKQSSPMSCLKRIRSLEKTDCNAGLMSVDMIMV